MTNNYLDEKKVIVAEDLINQGEFFKALKTLKDLENDYRHFIIHWYLGHIYFKLHKYSESINHIKKSIELKSKDALNLNFLGEIYLEINDYNQAKKLFEEVLKLDKYNKSAILNLAKIYFNEGKIHDGEKIYKDLVQKHPLNIGYHYQLIKISQKYLSSLLIKTINENYSKLSLNNKIYSNFILAKNNENKKEFSSEIDNLILAHNMYFESKKKAACQQFNFYISRLTNFIGKLKKNDTNINSDYAPIFIMGLPRSGTTLVEKIINSSKNKVQSLGETDVFDKVFFSNQIIKENEKLSIVPDLKLLQKKIINQYHSQGLGRQNLVFTDKSISNFLYLELILDLFPKAKFIYCYRNPTANIIGILRSFLPNVLWSHSLDQIFSIFNLYFQKLENIQKKKIN